MVRARSLERSMLRRSSSGSTRILTMWGSSKGWLPPQQALLKLPPGRCSSLRLFRTITKFLTRGPSRASIKMKRMMCRRLPTHPRRKTEILRLRENLLIRTTKRRDHKNRTKKRRQCRRSFLCDRRLGVLNSLLIDTIVKETWNSKILILNVHSLLSVVSQSSWRPNFGC